MAALKRRTAARCCCARRHGARRRHNRRSARRLALQRRRGHRVVPRRAAGDPADAGPVAAGGGAHAGLSRPRPLRIDRRRHAGTAQPGRPAQRTRIAAGRAARRSAALAHRGQRDDGRADAACCCPTRRADWKARFDALERNMPVAQAADFDPAQRTPEVIIRSETHGKLLAMALMTWARTDGGHDALRAAPRAAGRHLRARPAVPAPGCRRRRASPARCCRTGATTGRSCRTRCSAARRPAPPRYDETPGSAFHHEADEVRRASVQPTEEQRQRRAVLGRRSGQDTDAGRPLGLDPHRPAARPQGRRCPRRPSSTRA